MALKLKPPHHAADRCGSLILESDPAWDRPLIDAELAPNGVPLSYEAKMLHPFVRYTVGRTRYDLDAADWWDGQPCTVRSWLRNVEAGEGRPTIFRLRRLSAVKYQQALALHTQDALQALHFATLCLVALEDDFMPWTLGRAGEPDVATIIDRLHDADPAIPLLVGQAAILMHRPLDLAETFPSGC